MDFGARLARDNQIQRAGNTAIRYDDRTKVGAFHDALVVVQAETARSIAFSRFVVALNTASEKDWLDIVAKTDFPFAAGKQDTKREEAKFREIIRSNQPILLLPENDRPADQARQSWLSADSNRMEGGH